MLSFPKTVSHQTESNFCAEATQTPYHLNYVNWAWVHFFPSFCIIYFGSAKHGEGQSSAGYSSYNPGEIFFFSQQPVWIMILACITHTSSGLLQAQQKQYWSIFPRSWILYSALQSAFYRSYYCVNVMNCKTLCMCVCVWKYKDWSEFMLYLKFLFQ